MNLFDVPTVWTRDEGDLVVTTYFGCPDLVPEEADEYKDMEGDGPITVVHKKMGERIIQKEIKDKSGKIIQEAIKENVLEMIKPSEYRKIVEDKIKEQIEKEKLGK
jgi:hypothetical protein